MKKTTILLMVLITFLIIISVIVFVNARQIINQELNESQKEYDFMWTKAICNENYCQDYKIYCKNNQVIKQTPITGAILTIDKDWEDPRTIESREKLC